MYQIISSEPQSLSLEDHSEVWSKTLYICNTAVKKGLPNLQCPLVTDTVI
jgi:hypothetical protein